MCLNLPARSDKGREERERVRVRERERERKHFRNPNLEMMVFELDGGF